MDENKRYSDIGAEAAFRGFRTQTLYIINRILFMKDEEFYFQPEGEEDLAVYDSAKNLLEVIQVKNYNKSLTLSSLKPQKKDSFFKRSENKLETNKSLNFTLALFGEIGPELEKAILKNEDDRKNVIKKLKRFGYKEELMEILFRKLNFIEINEDDLYQNIKESFQNNPIVLLDLDIAFDLLMFWIYKLSEGKGFVNREILFEKLNKIGTFLVERKDFHSEYGNSIIPLDSLKINNTEINVARLKEEFYIGISAKYCHIENNLDVIRKDKLSQIENEFKKNNVIIVHGASGQGKSTLAYRFLHDFRPNIYSYKINDIIDKAHSIKIINTLRGIAKSVNLPLTIFIDVEPGNTSWVEIIKEVSLDFESFKFLITIREEDWKRANISGADLTFSDVELSLNKDEAQEIYKNLIEKKENIKFPSFEDAWIKFGEIGPLLEFVYLITQGNTLSERLKNQIKRIEEEAKTEDDYKKIELLKLVSLTCDYGGMIDLKKTIVYLKFNSPRFIIESLEKEYLIRKTHEGQYLEGLHPLRSKVLTELLFDDTFSSKEGFSIKILPLLSENTIGIFLLNYFAETKGKEEALKTLYNLPLVTWTGVNQVSNALLWLGVKDFIAVNKETFKDYYKEFNVNSLLALGFDISGSLGNINMFEALGDKYSRGKEKIDEYHKLLESNRSIVFEYAKTFLKKINIPIVSSFSSNELMNFGEILFWLGNFRIIKNISFNNLNMSFINENYLINDIADFILGLYTYNSTESIELFRSNRLLFLERIKKELEIQLLEEKDNQVITHHIVNILKEQETNLHDKTIKSLGVFRKIFPEKEMYSARVYGDEIPYISNEYTKIIKDIPKINLPLYNFVKLNAIFLGLTSFEMKPESWNEYVNTVFKQREEISDTLENLVFAIIKYFETKNLINIIGGEISFDSWEKVKKTTNYELMFPKILEEKKLYNNELTMSKNADVEKYEKFRKEYTNYLGSVNKFFSQAEAIILAQCILKNKNAFEKEKQLQGISNIRICSHNLKEAFAHLEEFQQQFRNHFLIFCDEKSLKDIEEKEEEVFKQLLSAWSEFIRPKFITNKNIGKFILENFDNKEKFLESLITDKLLNSKLDVKIPFEKDYKLYGNKENKIIILNSDSYLESFKNLEIFYKKAKETIFKYRDSFIERHIFESKFSYFYIIPLVKEKLVLDIGFKVPLFKLFEDSDIFDIVNCFPEKISDDIIDKFMLERWNSSAIIKLNTFNESINKVFVLLNSYTQISDLANMDVDDSSFSLVQDYTNNIFENMEIQNLLDSFIAIWNLATEENFMKEHNLEDKSEFLEELANIYSMVFESIIPQENEKKIEFNEIENWSNNFKDNYQNIMEFITYFYHVLAR